MTDTSETRAFLVGSGRSGTTLLEALLGAHPQIKGFPESDFFLGVIGQIDSRTRVPSEVPFTRRVGRVLTNTRVRLGIPNKDGSAQRTRTFLSAAKRPELFDDFPVGANTIAEHVDAFIAILDRLAREEGKSCWVEKSPPHLYYIDEIQEYVPGAKFIHIVRSGPDVVASLYDAGQKHPEAFRRVQTLDACINQWNRAIPITIRHLGKPNHFVVSYEQLVEDTAHVLRKLCDFLALPFSDAMLTDYTNVARFVSAGQVWKAGTESAITNANSTKFKTILTDEQQAHVLERLIKVDLAQFNVR